MDWRNWVVENEMKINPNKSKAISLTRARMKHPLNYSLRDQNIPEAGRLHGPKSLEGTIFRNAYGKKGK
jgi:hypothetical protein